MSMSKNLKIALLVAMGGGLLIAGNANAATATANSNISIVTGVALTKDADLDFGTVSQPTNGGDLTVAPGGTTSVTGDVVAPSTVTAAAFSATGQASTNVTITLPADGTVTMVSGANSIAVNGFQHDAGASPALDASGVLSFNVGATATIAGGQATGTYTGSFSVDVNY